MRILYLITAPRPVVAGTDAVVQEAELLRSRIGGEVVFLRPSSAPRARFPGSLYGLHCLADIRRRERERELDLHHLFHPELRYFPFLRFVRQPVVYTVASGLTSQRSLPPARALKRLSRILVPSESDLDCLARRGTSNGSVLPPAVDLSRFRPLPAPATPGFVLLAGSAPWTTKQFRTKGVDALLRAARKNAHLKLVFLFRGLLSRELRGRVDALGLAARVEIVEERVDVEQVLERVHAAVVLSDKAKLVKAYPHSLLEAVACGRPVLLSDCIAMSGFVRENGCGRLVRGVDETELERALEALQSGYQAYRQAACRAGLELGRRDVVETYRALYRSILENR